MKSWIYVEGLWLGLNPFNADAIDLNSEFTMNCLIANVDISVPPSADIFGQVGDEHDPGGPVENTWHREYYSPDNEMSCNMPTSVAHEAKGIFTFWSYSVTARAYNSNSLL